MSSLRIEPLRPERFADFVQLICALAHYEHLPPPDAAAQQRLYADAFHRTPPRYTALLAIDDGAVCGYCMFFETYSSFLAKPTLFIEDIFVLPQWRGRGIGRALLAHVALEARKRSCGRMEWLVLDWNEPAKRFYERVGAQCLQQWQLYRMTEETFARLADEVCQ